MEEEEEEEDIAHLAHVAMSKDLDQFFLTDPAITVKILVTELSLVHLLAQFLARTAETAAMFLAAIDPKVEMRLL